MRREYLIRFWILGFMVSVANVVPADPPDASVSDVNAVADDAAPDMTGKVDDLAKRVAEAIPGLTVVATIDHARLAFKSGVRMPASIVTIFTDPKVNAPLMELQPRLGLDLPCKVLACQTGAAASVVYPTGQFLARRHGIKNPSVMLAYDRAIDRSVSGVSAEQRQPVEGKDIGKDFAIVEMTSDFPFQNSIDRLKQAVLQQGDTVWFGELDYRKEAATQGTEITDATLLLFGGPAPGGKAMAEYPKLGLDAFCQKLLVYRETDGTVRVIFNDIVALAEMHYGSSNMPQKIINGRLKQTFLKAITESRSPGENSADKP